VKYLSLIINIILGILFFISAYTKLFPVEYFELELVEKNISSWSLSPFVARFIIAFEFFLGAVLLLQLKIKKLTLPFAIGFLSLMSAYLMFQLINNGNQENCGCYGEIIPLTTIESLIKNVVFIILSIISLKFLDRGTGYWKKYRSKKISILYFALLPLSTISVGIVNPPIDIYKQEYSSELKVGDPFQMSFPGDIDYPKEFYLALVSAECGHCKRVKRKIDVAKRKYSKFPEVFFFIEGQEDSVNDFMFNSDQTYVYFSISPKDLLSSTHGNFPMVVHVKNQVIIGVENSRDFLKNDFDNIVD